MILNIPRLIRPLNLSDYAPEMDAVIYVWVNPPRATLSQYYQFSIDTANALDAIAANSEDEAAKRKLEKSGDDLITWLVEIWGQGPEDTTWTHDGIKELLTQCLETDPALWPWLVRRTHELIKDHREGAKKKLGVPS